MSRRLIRTTYILIAFVFGLVGPLTAQVVTSIPAFPTINDSVVVIFNAKEGDGGLAGYTGDVYAHTGVITSESRNPRDWRYVLGQWCQDATQPKLVDIGADLWLLNIGDIRQFYGIPASEKVLKLAFVFRAGGAECNDGNPRSGRDVGGADIFLDLYEPGLTAVVLQPEVRTPFGDPARSPAFVNLTDTLQITTTAVAIGTQTAEITLKVDGTPVATVADDTLAYAFVGETFGAGLKRLTVVVEDTAANLDSTTFAVMVNPEPVDLPVPTGIVDGINYVGGNRVTLSLFAPYKDFVYVLGDFNDWKVDAAYMMNRHAAGSDSLRFWLTLENLDPDTEYAFQYLVDGRIRIADPYTEKVLTPFDDKFIPAVTYPNLKPYPEGKTEHNVSVFQINEPEYVWQVTDFQRPRPEDLVVYELLVRDFIARHDYTTLIDTLDYLQNLGINAIHLMPIMEFEGNISWGYNPAFYFAPDKYYGPEYELKRFIDACHQRGIAVILDIVLNHSFGQSPLVRLYAEGEFGPPTPENPWYNVTPRHPFNVGFDFNHESPATQALVDRATAYWLTEYRVDGYRFDLSKGFTQKFSGNDVGLWSAYDASRIALLKRMADALWQVDSTAYIILEHFADNREEKELADYGMLLWGNLNTAYSQSAMGWLEDPARRSDLAWGFYKQRGWAKPHLLTYMESHDEPWLMFKNLRYGRSSPDGSYNVKELTTALDRIKLAATFFLTLPGPKMLWQFGELGYDQFLPPDGPERTAPKPILWNYFQDESRRNLYKFISALLELRKKHEVFRSPNTQVKLRVGHAQYDRRINLLHFSMNVTIIGNFHVVPLAVNPDFPHPGTWYNYFTGDSLEVTDTNAPIELLPGEFRLYTNKRLETPDVGPIVSVDEPPPNVPFTFELSQNFPNPFNPETTLAFSLPKPGKTTLTIYNVLGRKIRTLLNRTVAAGQHRVQWDGRDDSGREAASGLYLVRLRSGNQVASRKIVKLK